MNRSKPKRHKVTRRKKNGGIVTYFRGSGSGPTTKVKVAKRINREGQILRDYKSMRAMGLDYETIKKVVAEKYFGLHKSQSKVKAISIGV